MIKGIFSGYKFPKVNKYEIYSFITALTKLHRNNKVVIFLSKRSQWWFKLCGFSYDFENVFLSFNWRVINTNRKGKTATYWTAVTFTLKKEINILIYAAAFEVSSKNKMDN